MRIRIGDIIEYEETVRRYFRYLVLDITYEDKEKIQCWCLIYNGTGYDITPHIIWKNDSYQRDKIIAHVNTSKLALLKE